MDHKFHITLLLQALAYLMTTWGNINRSTVCESWEAIVLLLGSNVSAAIQLKPYFKKDYRNWCDSRGKTEIRGCNVSYDRLQEGGGRIKRNREIVCFIEKEMERDGERKLFSFSHGKQGKSVQ